MMPNAEPARVFSDFLSILRRSTDLLNEDPVREEIFSIERLEQFAAHLASELQVKTQPHRGRALLPVLEESGRKLLAAYQELTRAIRSKQAVSPAAEWFVDNFHLVEDQLREIKQDLPEHYYAELPKLAEGQLEGFPRVYAIALAILTHTDSRLDSETLKRFLQAYQKVAPLQIGELWAVAITLRIALVEQLTSISVRVVSARKKREEADALADKMLEFAARSGVDPKELVKMLSQKLASPEDFDRAFIVQLLQRLRDQDPDVWPAFDWLEKQLETFHTNTQLLTQLEHHRQAAAQVKVGNIITSMRLLSTLDWRDFFEAVSLVDPILALDPLQVYQSMDFETRDRYRHAVERIARQSSHGEIAVATRAIEAARMASAQVTASTRAQAHVGFYLIGEGRALFEKSLGYRSRFFENFSRFLRRRPTLFFLASLSLLTALLLMPLLGYFGEELEKPQSLWIWLAFALLIFIPTSDFALSILNHYINFFIKPKPLPKMNLDKGLPADATTMVVIPTLFTKASTVKELIDSLQIHYLANQDPHIYFALLADLTDSDVEVTPLDSQLIALAYSGIRELNEKYSPSGHPRFYVFHRRRQWNSSENKFIGWERKRGKIHEFNRVLRGDKDTSYVDIKAPPELLASVKYVITLDSDTQLPRDAAHQLVGTIIHPLNQPYYDPHEQRVTKGYGILQPRISVSMLSAARTRFAHFFSGNTGLDPYTTAVSDVYQDLFNEGSYTGKGLYVVDAFESSLAGKVPENCLLSHDLFEGSFARSALVTNVELFDDYPSDYETYAKRQHRWTRGDWQIAQWLLPSVPGPSPQKPKVSNKLSLISRWKIFDNLRRSVVAPTMLLWLSLSWTLLPGSPFVWTAFILLMLAFPIYAPISNGLWRHQRGISWRGHLRSMCVDSLVQIIQILLSISFLPHQAWNQVDAILRTLYRKWISHKNLLEWVSFAQTQQQSQQRVPLLKSVGAAPCFATLLAVTIGFTRPESFIVATPFISSWLLLPFLSRWLSRRAPITERFLTPTEVQCYRHYARRTWHFFENFVGAEDNWLAPDNFQEEPKPVVAHRSSPTNFGLQLLATASALDLGYIGLFEFVERSEMTLATLEKLPKMRGHFFNWYNTQTLEALRPQYISTVDSGNLCGHLLTFKQSCLSLRRRPWIHPHAQAGLLDTLSRLQKEAQTVGPLSQGSGLITIEQLQSSIELAVHLVLDATWSNISDWEQFLHKLWAQLNEADDFLNALATNADPKLFSDTHVWMAASLHQVKELRRDLELLSNKDNDLDARLQKIAQQAHDLAMAMDFRFLFDEQRKIFVIGYNVADSRLDNSYYDLLASESRLTSFVAIAKGDIPKEHWFRLGRQMTAVAGGRALISWTATMFEYLMPLLVMRRYPDTLLDQTYETVVARQIEYAKQRGVPWGISEAGYNARDLQLNYQYGPFGVPGLGLKRGLSDDLVVSPYSTMLAALIDPGSALSNLQRLEKNGALARYGFFESIDYTSDRLQKKQKSFILRSFMAHHQGMSLVAINNLLNFNIMQRRFHAEPLMQATELLLQERIPNNVTVARPRAEEVKVDHALRFSSQPNIRVYTDAALPTPRTQLLSNGNYSVMISTAGSGYSRCGNLAISRWREDVTRDHWGHFFFIRNRSTGQHWSTGAAPTKYEVSFAEDKVEFWRRDGKILTHTEIIVSPEDNVELRRISLTNHSSEAYELEVTSFMEVVLAPPADDAAHPAFSNLFVQTEFAPGENALLATRRRRSQMEKQVWGFHVMVTEGETIGAVHYETDRARFIGRGRHALDPIVVAEDRPLSNTVGSVLDPIFSLSQSVRVRPGETVRVSFATGVADSRDEALRLVDKYHDIHIFAREAELAWTQSQVQLRHLNIGSDKAHTFQRLAGRVIYSDSSLRPRSHVLALNTRAQSSLWAYGIGGDLPIILTRISDEKDMAMVRELLHAHEYLRLKGLLIDLVILNERAPSYIQSLQEELQRQIRISGSQALLDKTGGVFIRRSDIIPPEDVILLKTVARVTLSAEKGTLDEQLKRRPVVNELPPALVPNSAPSSYKTPPPAIPELTFFNGLGGFASAGREYVIILKEGQWTPAPWINVIANEHDFGFTVSEAGAGYTWSTNSRENRLSPWSNDSISDPVGETIYIRDEESGEYWSPTPLPIRDSETYVITHAQGFSQFEHSSHGIKQHLQIFVPMDAPVKISRLRLKNLGREKRKLSVTSYVEWVLGFQRGQSAPYVISEVDPHTGTLFAKNPYNNEFATRVAFADFSESKRSFTCDRKEFLGRNGGPARPAAMERVSLSGTAGAGLDPCAALQSSFELRAGEEREFIFILGQTKSREEAQALSLKYRDSQEVERSFKKVVNYWDQLLGAIEIKTPDLAMNTLMNRWLLYQNLSCRIWARSAFYQSGGAYGFRDQLQDVMALVYAQPDITRAQILRAAERQFPEGDVQHWWHPPTGRGVRTKISDDLIFLAFVTSFYIKCTGDASILDEVVPFIEGPELEAGHSDSYTLPPISKQTATLREHCARALDRSLKVGVHGLPLMGSGDWNDGMSRVGHEGKGESVWVAWFLIATLKDFIPHFEKAGDSARTEIYRKHIEDLTRAIETHAWDGDWYKRAYFDDGQALGSAVNQECRIDSIAQSWAVLSGAGNPQRASRAMAAVDEYLVHRGDGMVKLFVPPFDKSPMDPGYIKGYVPGVRENGGQYTHAAIWTLMAFAKLGDGDRAGELYALLNPINHSSTRAGLHKYKVEPYVAAADIYGLWPHIGRGGWTWYTGSASWMYRAALESILGFDLRGDKLVIKPCIPSLWNGFEINYRHRKNTQYKITVSNRTDHGTQHEALIQVDGVKVDSEIPLVEDGREHRIHVQL